MGPGDARCWIYVLWLSSVSLLNDAGCPPNDHYSIPTFGEDCKYRCRCHNQAVQCNNITGSCANGCASDWMGPACQYRKAKVKSTTLEPGSGKVNEDQRTCSEIINENQYWNVSLERVYNVVGLVINVSFYNDSVSNGGFRIIASNGTNDTVCNELTNITGNVTREVICRQAILADNVRVWPTIVPSSLCKLDIYGGGRLMSFGRHVSQSSVLIQNSTKEIKNWYPKQAVDGRPVLKSDIDAEKGTFDYKVCAATLKNNGEGTENWWKLDLKSSFRIEEIHVYGRRHKDLTKQTSNFTLEVIDANNATVFEYQDNSSTSVRDYQPRYVLIVPAVDGQYVRISKKFGEHLILCEVEVFADCLPGYCGWDCNDTCHCAGVTTGENRIKGNCPNGCKDRWTGHGLRCDQQCSSNQWGPSCNLICGKCQQDNQTCDVTNGHCPSNCELSWKPPLCVEKCDDGTYGRDCNSSCGNCKGSAPCDKETGKCITCEDGYQPPYCFKRCEPGTYGDQCGSQCGHCDDANCTHTNGSCPYGCQTGFVEPYCQKRIEDPEPSKTPVIAAGLGAVAVLIVLVVAIAVVVKMKRREQNKQKANGNTLNSRTDGDTVEMHSQVEDINRVSEEIEYCNVNQPLPPESIEVNNLEAFCRAIRKDPTKIVIEYSNLAKGHPYEADAARRKNNRAKNRYKEMYPYDKNRVLLPHIQGHEDSNYINASYINGYSSANAYIACQGAMTTTINDTWRMIWSEDIKVIVMLTRCVEKGRNKCEQYWPDGQTVAEYGEITVEGLSEEIYAEFVVRRFSCRKKGDASTRLVSQFHYTAWPDKDVPDTDLSIVQFWNKVRCSEHAQKEPWLVHCSAGVGRTGTFIALDYCFKRGKAETVVNVKACVQEMREQRTTMVQTKDQYLCLHYSLCEALRPIGETFNVEEFKHYWEKLQSKGKRTFRKLEKEFKKLCDKAKDLTDEPEDNTYGNLQAENQTKSDPYGDSKISENMSKSRNNDIIPPDMYRPHLSPMTGESHSDYINAVYISTYRTKNKFILTQLPIKNTVVDFIRMVWEFDINIIVLMESYVPEDDVYWPGPGADLSHGPFTLTHISDEQESHHVCRTFNIHYEGNERGVSVLHFTSWPSDMTVPCAHGALSGFMAEVDTLYESTPIVVQCMDGASRSGLFVVVSGVLERMLSERDVLIAETIQQMRYRRKQIIPCIEQYTFCHEEVYCHISNDQVYSNLP